MLNIPPYLDEKTVLDQALVIQASMYTGIAGNLTSATKSIDHREVARLSIQASIEFHTELYKISKEKEKELLVPGARVRFVEPIRSNTVKGEVLVHVDTLGLLVSPCGEPQFAGSYLIEVALTTGNPFTVIAHPSQFRVMR